MEPKVKIGCYYQRPLRVENDPDMILMQRALLGDREKPTQWWVYLILIIAWAFGIFLMWVK
jgi:uncharacterized membrane protein